MNIAPSSAPPLSGGANLRALIAAISGAVVCGIVFGLSMPLISLRLEEMTGSGLQVGLNALGAALSTIVMAPLTPRLMRLLPPRLILMGALVLAAGLFALMPLFPNPAAWFVLRFAMGCGVTVIFVISETWINQRVLPQRRALMLGVYGTALSAGFGAGGLLFAALHGAGDLAFYLGAAIFMAGLAPLFLPGPSPEAPESEATSMRAMIQTVRSSPAAITAGLAFGALETLIFSLIAVYGLRIGLSEAAGGLMVFAIAMGALTLQIPLGWIADRRGRRPALLAIALFAAIAPWAIALAGSDLRLLLPLLFLQAGMASGLYTVGLSLLGERFTGGGLAAANAAFIFAYGVGSLIAPPIAGGAMDTVGPWGFLAVLSLIAALQAGFMLLRRRRTHPPD